MSQRGGLGALGARAGRGAGAGMGGAGAGAGTGAGPRGGKDKAGAAGEVRDKINYHTDADKVGELLGGFTYERSPGNVCFKYREMLQEIADRRRVVLEVSLDDVAAFRPGAEGAFEELAKRMQRNTLRYVQLVSAQADKLMPEPTDPGLRAALAGGDLEGQSVQEIYRIQRLQQWRAREALREAAAAAAAAAGGAAAAAAAAAELDGGAEAPPGGAAAVAKHELPAELMRRFEVVIVPPAKQAAGSLRAVDAGQIGRLVRVKGIVVRVSDVKPRAVVVSYICDECGAELYQKVPDSGEFMPLDSCVTPACARLPKKAKARVNVSVRGSRFEKFQELKIQETPEQVPVGHIPRSITVHCRGESTRQCSPGDVVEAVGIYLPRQLGAFEQMRMELMQSTFLLCMQIRRTKKNYSELAREALGADMDEEVDEIAEAPEGERYERLARSIAPEIYGMADVKKALLLQLVGGVTRKPGDGMSIRGDLNVLLMGDPGVAKSQLLKYISSVAPRGVYTTGKGSSGVGLTACVTRDKSTGEVALEGGALVLADLSVCCIDEFDKMEEADRTAIHEVMEQQTVSIAKAGVTTTLNARTSILAAANPVLGRYNPRMSIAENINLPTALLSRFDLQFLLRDVADLDNDIALARHITHVHRFAKHPKLAFAPVRPAVLRAYIALARKVQPVVPERLEGSIVQAYVEMRREDLRDAEERGAMPQLTARQLLSVLRMAQALARLRFDEEVSERDVAEAIRLIKVSKEELSESERDAAAGPNRQNRQDDLVSRCFNVVVQAHKAQGGRALRYADVEQTVLAKGFTAEQLAATLDDYENLNVVQRSANGATIYFVGEP